MALSTAIVPWIVTARGFGSRMATMTLCAFLFFFFFLCLWSSSSSSAVVDEISHAQNLVPEVPCKQGWAVAMLRLACLWRRSSRRSPLLAIDLMHVTI
jgi:hypothetical protein